MTDQATPAGTDPAATACENCGATLHGSYCHACGQSIHNPIRHAGHALEEFFEAFWHLDGRLFRTLRDLVSPGRLAINYLAGHRARYIAPLRLFVVLSLLTFFIGSAAVHVEDGRVEVDGIGEIESARSVGDVERVRDRLLADIDQARSDAGNVPGVSASLVAAQVRIRSAAADRIVALGGSPPADAAGRPATTPPVRPDGLRINLLGHRGEWDARDNPLVIGWWPGFANDWLNRRIGNLETNMHSLDGAGADIWVDAVMSAAPTALFLLVPVFAVLLKIAYLFTRRLYLEHLVVALYSHAFLLVMLTLLFALSALDRVLTSTAAGMVLGLAMTGAMLWMPVYLLLMQKRVYGQAWWLTVLKHLVLAFVYFWMLMVATLLVFLGRLTAA